MQSLRAVQRLRAVGSIRQFHATQMMSNISGGSLGKAWADKEHAAENQYFNKKDAEVLAQLADKLKHHTAPTVETKAQAQEALLAIFAKHEITPSDALVDDIMNFKFNNH